MRKNVVRLLAAIMLMLLPVLALAEGNSFAVVKGGKLNLREYASSSSRSLGKYSTGSWVRIVGGGSGGFTEVRTMDGKHGYMSDSYLDFGAGANSGTVRYANGGYVNLRSGPSLNYSVVVRVTSGSTVYIQDESYEWNYITVWQNGYTYTGYMHESFINKSTSTATVTTRNGGKVNVRSGPSSSYSSVGSLASGTKVSVLLKGNGWYQISANGIVGFMSTQYLSGTGNTVGSNTGSATTSTQVAYVNNPRSTQVLNLRESPSQTARSIGQYRNGTQVKVVSKGATWCEVYVGTRHGYMMTKYLSFNGSYVQPTYTATPVYIYVTPTPSPTPLVQLVTAVPPAGPAAGTAVSLVTAAGASNNLVNVYNDSSLTSLKAVYEHGKQATMLQYGASVCMVLVDGGVAYVSTGNVNY
ncbi:MAG: SH3 domain-containing protein [Clostridia bacterium]|nr:SH3 domain-containing protein [Clostridia bacterium]